MHTTVTAIVFMLFTLIPLTCCDKDSPTKAEKAAAKQQRESMLLGLPYPKLAGPLPKSIEVRYDSTSDRTTTVLTFTSLRAAPGSELRANPVQLTLISSHKGRTRAANNTEGAVDGAFVGIATSQGALAFAGSPGLICVDGVDLELAEASNATGYTGVPATGGFEETVRFRVPTEHLVAAAGGKSVTFKFAGAYLELSGAQLADLRALAATLNPRP